MTDKIPDKFTRLMFERARLWEESKSAMTGGPPAPLAFRASLEQVATVEQLKRIADVGAENAYQIVNQLAAIRKELDQVASALERFRCDWLSITVTATEALRAIRDELRTINRDGIAVNTP